VGLWKDDRVEIMGIVRRVARLESEQRGNGDSDKCVSVV
jgi:hypothetical protein